jgi:hypothetical protein
MNRSRRISVTSEDDIFLTKRRAKTSNRRTRKARPSFSETKNYKIEEFE